MLVIALLVVGLGTLWLPILEEQLAKYPLAYGRCCIGAWVTGTKGLQPASLVGVMRSWLLLT